MIESLKLTKLSVVPRFVHERFEGVHLDITYKFWATNHYVMLMNELWKPCHIVITSLDLLVKGNLSWTVVLLRSHPWNWPNWAWVHDSFMSCEGVHLDQTYKYFAIDLYLQAHERIAKTCQIVPTFLDPLVKGKCSSKVVLLRSNPNFKSLRLCFVCSDTLFRNEPVERYIFLTDFYIACIYFNFHF